MIDYCRYSLFLIMNKEVRSPCQTLVDAGVSEITINDIPIDNITDKILSAVKNYENYYLTLADKFGQLPKAPAKEDLHSFALTHDDIAFFEHFSNSEVLDIMSVSDWLAFEYLVAVCACYFSGHRLKHLTDDEMKRFFNLTKPE